MPDSETPERHRPWQRAVIAALPLPGVVLAGLSITSGVTKVAVEPAVSGLLPGAIVAFSGITFPLAVYAALYAACLAQLQDRSKNRVSLLRIISVCLIIFIGTMLAGPYMIYVLSLLAFSVLGVLAFGVAPLLCGMLYGAFLAAMAGIVSGWGPPHRLRAHLLGGGAAGLLVFAVFFYPARFPFEAPDEGVAVSGRVLLSAIVLALCYLPHILATRPWRPERPAPCPH